MKIIKSIKQKFFEPREVVVASSSFEISDMRKVLGEKAKNLTDEQALKLFMELPEEDQVKVFFPKIK